MTPEIFIGLPYYDRINYNTRKMIKRNTKIQIFKKDEISKAVVNETGVSLENLMSRKRTSEIVEARQIFFYLCDKFTDLTFTCIGKTLNRHHATVIYAVNRVPDLMTYDKMFKQKVLSLQNKIETILN